MNPLYNRLYEKRIVGCTDLKIGIQWLVSKSSKKISRNGIWSKIEHIAYLTSEPNKVIIIGRDLITNSLNMRIKTIDDSFIIRTPLTKKISLPKRGIHYRSDYDRETKYAHDLDVGDEFCFSMKEKQARRWAIVQSIQAKKDLIIVTGIVFRRDQNGAITTREFPKDMLILCRKLKDFL